MRKPTKNKITQDELPKAVREMQKEANELKEKNKIFRKDKEKLKELNKKNEKKKRKNKLRRYILIIILIIILVLGVKIAIDTHNWKVLTKDMSLNENSTVKDSDGKTIAKLGSEKKKKTIDYDKIPKNLKNAYVAIEDERFYSHQGVDAKRTLSAIGSYIIHFGSSSYGGSTITQQLVKNITGDGTDSIKRKISEWWKAWQLETCLSKDEILDTYLNIIYVGPSIYGVETGAQYYFNKSVESLTLEECAFLAGINHSPNSYNPFSSDNTEGITKRTKTVLAKMKELEYINESEYNTAIKKVDNGLKFKKGEVTADSGIYSYHTDALIPEITEDIRKKFNISETFATNYINMAGLTIYSNQNTSIQKQTEIEFEKKKYVLDSKNAVDSSQAAMVIMDHKTGYVVACTGGLGKKTKARTFNRATQSVRQTGSAIKPIAVLAPAIDKKIITASTILDDTEQDFENNYHPTDYSKSLGKITVRRAVESSQNIPFVEIMEKLTPKTSIKYLEKMGITTLTEKDNSLPLSLGGLENGISPLQMAGAYATIANDGKYIEPTFYNKIERKNGYVILKPNQKTKNVFSKEVSYILKEILTQPVLGEKGTATYCKISGVDVAAKTGTTDENYDRWLCGFTPYYTAITWYGFDKNESINFNQRNPAGLIWANVMSRIHTGLKSATFEKPSAITECTICAETGERARADCKNTYTEYFLWFTAPNLCSKHNGNELQKIQKDKTTNIKDNATEIIRGITEDIDETEPQRTDNIIDNTTNSYENKTTTNNTKYNSINNSTQNNTINTNENRETTTNLTENTHSNTNININTTNTNNTIITTNATTINNSINTNVTDNKLSTKAVNK